MEAHVGKPSGATAAKPRESERSYTANENGYQRYENEKKQKS